MWIFDREMTGVIDEAEFFGRYKRSLINGQIVTWEFRRSLSFDSPSGLVGVKQTVLERDFYFQEESTASHLWFQVNFPLFFPSFSPVLFFLYYLLFPFLSPTFSAFLHLFFLSFPYFPPHFTYFLCFF